MEAPTTEGNLKKDGRWRYAIATLGGLVLTAAFPNINLAGAAWIGPGVVLFSALGATPRQCFKLGFTAGLIHFLTCLYWLLNMPYTFHGVPLAPALGWMALSAYCALFPAIWVWLCWSLWGGKTSCISIPAALEDFLSSPALRRQAWGLSCAAVWVATEMVRGRFLSGFPWNFLGSSQYRMLPLIQIASTTAIYGVSFLVVWTSVALGAALLRLARHPKSSYGPWGEVGLAFLIVAAVAVTGANAVKTIPVAQEHLKVAMIQPSMPQTLIFDPRENSARFERAMALSEQAAAAKPDLIIWPESALPAVTPEMGSALTAFIARHRLWMIVSGDDEKPSARGTFEYFNAAFLFDPNAVTRAVYHKRRLVIFGEYVPLIKWLPFLKWLTPVGDSSYTPGSETVPFPIEHPQANIGVLICFEDVFADEVRQHVQGDTDFLINLTNDGWFGESAEQWQQAASAVFRAIENGVPLARCTNNGLTCWIDERGRMRQILESNGSVYRAGYMIADIPLRASGSKARTFYNRHGDWFGWACVGITALFCIKAAVSREGRAPRAPL